MKHAIPPVIAVAAIASAFAPRAAALERETSFSVKYCRAWTSTPVRNDGCFVATDIPLTSNSVVETDLEVCDSASTYMFSAGAYQLAAGTNWSFTYGGKTVRGGAVEPNRRYLVKTSPQGLFVDGGQVAAATPASFTNKFNLTLFSSAGGNWSRGHLRFYSMKVYEPDANGEFRLAHELKPCMIVGGKMGVYDEIGGGVWANGSDNWRALGGPLVVPAPGGVGDVGALTNALLAIRRLNGYARECGILLEPGAYAVSNLSMAAGTHIVLDGSPPGLYIAGTGARPEDTVLVGGGVEKGLRVLHVGSHTVTNLVVKGGFLSKSLPPLPPLPQQLKALPGAAKYAFHLTRDDYANSLGLDFDSLDPRGYYIAIRGTNVVLAGRTGVGNGYALADFLKRFAGYRNFGTRFGTVPAHVDGELTLPEELTAREEPDVLSVNIAGGGGLGNFGREGVTLQATHAMSSMVGKEMFAEHPEYFPMVRGERHNPSKGGPWNPGMSNPDLPLLFHAYADRYFKKHPDKHGIPMGVNDGGGDCNCPDCLALYGKHGNQYAAFYNMAAKRLAKSHPGKYLAFIAYSTRCSKVPKGLTMEPNILVEVTGSTNTMAAWRAIGVRNFGVYEYLYGFNGSTLAPAYYPHEIASYFRTAYREYGMKSLWQEYYAWAPIIDAGRQYVIDELMWDMDADVDALLGDYFKSLYGPAEKPVRRFHDMAEAAFARRMAAPGWSSYMSNYHRPDQFQGYSFDDLAAMDAALAEAAEAAKGDETVARRVRLLGKLWSFQKALIENYICAREIDKSSDPGEIAALARRAAAAIAVTESFFLTPDEASWIRCSNGDGPFKAVHGDATAPKPILDRAIGEACARATAALGRDAARAAWSRLADDPVMAPYAGTELYLMDHELVNLARNPSFEDLVAVSQPLGPEASSDWFPLNLAGRCWARWTFPNTQAQVFVDSSEAHTGTNSVCIIRNQYGAGLLTIVGGQSGARYRVSAWVRQRNGMSVASGGFSVRFKKSDGSWLGGRSSIGAKIPQEALERWVKVSCSFTAPESPLGDGKVGIHPVFGAPSNQAEDDRTWWDDVSIEKIWEAPRAR